LSSAGTLASSSLRNGASLPGIFAVPIEVMVRCFGTGNAESGSASRVSATALPAGAVDVLPGAAVAFAITSPDPSALTRTLGPICMAVNDSALLPLENSITTMLGWLMTDGFSLQPCGFREPR
jgi:hypothetical protein